MNKLIIVGLALLALFVAGCEQYTISERDSRLQTDQRSIDNELLTEQFERIDELVAQGEITQEDAERQKERIREMHQMRREMEQRPPSPEEQAMNEYFEELQEQVMNGEITQEEAMTLRQEFRIQQQIDQGHITEEQAEQQRARMREIQEIRSQPPQQTPEQEAMNRYFEQLQEQVMNGEITQEEAQEMRRAYMEEQMRN